MALLSTRLIFIDASAFVLQSHFVPSGLRLSLTSSLLCSCFDVPGPSFGLTFDLGSQLSFTLPLFACLIANTAYPPLVLYLDLSLVRSLMTHSFSFHVYSFIRSDIQTDIQFHTRFFDFSQVRPSSLGARRYPGSEFRFRSVFHCFDISVFSSTRASQARSISS